MGAVPLELTVEGSPVVKDSPQSPASPATAGRGPVTRDDLRALRRWTLVAGIWAVAATAVALIALLDTSRGDAEQRASDAEQRSAEVEKRVTKLDRDQRGLATRTDEVESRLGGLAPLSDVSKLQDRVGRAEEDASAANDRAGNQSDKLSSLEDRIATLEAAPPSSSSDTSNTKKP